MLRTLMKRKTMKKFSNFLHNLWKYYVGEYKKVTLISKHPFLIYELTFFLYEISWNLLNVNTAVKDVHKNWTKK